MKVMEIKPGSSEYVASYKGILATGDSNLEAMDKLFNKLQNHDY